MRTWTVKHANYTDTVFYLKDKTRVRILNKNERGYFIIEVKNGRQSLIKEDDFAENTIFPF